MRKTIESLDMTAAEFRAIRERLGLSADDLAYVLGAGSGRTVRRWEAGERSISGPVQRLIRVMVASADARALLGVKLLKKEATAAEHRGITSPL